MSRSSILIAFAISLLFVACKTPKPFFPKEDLYYMSAVDSFENRDYNASAYYYDQLYKNTEKTSYLLNYFDVMFLTKKDKVVEAESRKFLDDEYNEEVKRYLVLSLYRQKKDAEAIKLGEEIIKNPKVKRAKDYIILADLYLKKKEYQKALVYYESGYAIKNEPVLVDKIAYLLFEKLDRKKEAIAYIETHIRLNECNLYLCTQLANYYLKLGDIKSIVTVYKKLYEKTNDSLIGKKIVELLVLRKNYDGLAEFLELTGLDDKMLFEIYKMRKDFKNMARLSLKIYESTMDVKYLAQNAMYEFERSKIKSKELIGKTIKKLEEVVKSNQSPIYLNYLGYMLIDYDVDVKKGIGLVEQALEKDRNNIFYKDSLAWGEYKLENYQKAYDLMVDVKKEIGNDKTVMKHYERIKKSCIKSKKCKVK